MDIKPAPADLSHILLVDDDSRLRNLLDKYLTKNGFRVTCAADSRQARKFLDIFEFDMILLDVMMPGETGLELTKYLRAFNSVPILLLTAMNETEDRILGLETGADDYLSKPFEPRELLLRIENILRRVKLDDQTTHNEEVFQFGPYRFDLRSNLLYRGPIMTKLTESETVILRAFVASPGTVLSRDDLSKLDSSNVNTRTIDVQITRLRKKIEDDPKFPRYLQTIRGQGYVFKLGL